MFNFILICVPSNRLRPPQLHSGVKLGSKEKIKLKISAIREASDYYGNPVGIAATASCDVNFREPATFAAIIQ